MFGAKLEVDSISSFEPWSDFPHANLTKSSCCWQLNGRLSVSAQSVRSVAFDKANIFFRGVICSNIDGITVAKEIVCLGTTRSTQDFEQYFSSNKSDKIQSIFRFDISSNESLTENGQKVVERYLPPTMSVSGSKAVTQSSALSDHHIVKGSVQVQYCMEVQFLKRNKLVYNLTQPIILSYRTADIPLEVIPQSKAQTQLLAKTGLLRNFLAKSQPTLKIDVFHTGSTPIRRNPLNGHRIMTIPITITLTDLNKLNKDTVFPDSLRCLVEARWHTHTTFALLPREQKLDRSLRASSITQDSRTLLQKHSIDFPPLCRIDTIKLDAVINPGQAPYSSTAHLQIGVPDSICSPNLTEPILSRRYSLELTLKFESCKTAKDSDLRCWARTKLPLSIHRQQLTTEEVLESPASWHSESSSYFDDLHSVTSYSEAHSPLPPPPYVDAVSS